VPNTSLPSFTDWSSFPFEGEFRVKKLEEPVAVEPPRKGEDKADCAKCHTPDDAYIWVNENWRVRSMDHPSGLPMVLILESRSHLDLGDLPNMLAAELGVMTVRLERAIRSLDGVARVHVNRWGDGAAHLHLWFMARPQGRLQLRGSFLTLWDEILSPIPESQWRENLALIAAWLAEFGGEPLAKPPRIEWKTPSSFAQLLPAADQEFTTDNGAEPDRAPEEPVAELDEPEPATPEGDSEPAPPDEPAPPVEQAAAPAERAS
jgi:diadenosine tetraphosphate (Ap4A) HIT family hydrolase